MKKNPPIVYNSSCATADDGSKECKDKERALSDQQPPPYLHMGSTEPTKASAWQGTLVELAGSLVLTFVSIAAVIACFKAQFKFPPIPLNSSSYTLCILATAPVSGGHLNPCFSFTTRTYLVCKIHALHCRTICRVYAWCVFCEVCGVFRRHTYSLGGCLLKQQVLGANQMINSLGVDAGPGLVSEVMFTFLLISVAFPLILEYSNTTHFGDPRLVKGAFITGLLLGLHIFVSEELLAPGYTSAGMNPARCLGPAMAHGGASLWHSQWVFWNGPLLAGLFFAILYRIVHWCPCASVAQTFIPAEAQSKLPIKIASSPVKERRDFLADPPSTEANFGVSGPTPSLQTNMVPVALPQAQLTSARRMDVFLHIKAMVQKQESEKEGLLTTWSASGAQDESDVERTANVKEPTTTTISSGTSVVTVARRVRRIDCFDIM